MYVPLILLLIATQAISERRFLSDVKNITNNQTRQNVNEGNALKHEIAKYLKECSMDASQEDSMENNRRTKHDGSGGSYPEFYGESKQRQIDENNKKRFSNRSDQLRKSNDDNSCQGYNDQNYNRNFDRNYNENNRENQYRNNREYQEYNRNRPENQNYGNPYKEQRNTEYGNVDFGNRRDNPMFDNFRSSTGMIRVRREDETCVSQCVFGYLEMLDDNRVPSESAVVKFYKEHVSNDRKRINMIREARRCFARLATIDNEDGCEFSKSLGKCLKLDIE